MVTGNQIRLGRFALRWSIQELSDRTGVSIRTLKRIEADDSVPSASANTLLQLQTALESAGIEFIGTVDEGPGIRLWKKGPQSAEDAAPGSA